MHTAIVVPQGSCLCGRRGAGRGEDPGVVEGDLILGRFLVGERLGQGGFGVVHRAWDRRLDRAVAVKEIVAGDDERVRREAQAAARLNHPGIVTLFELGAERSSTYLVSELVEGATLRELIDERAISDRDVAVIGSELCAALAHAHGRGIVHRDIKPENVIVADGTSSPSERRGQVKLMDFGIAAIAGSPTLTATGQVLGTLAYVAPEQAEGGASGPEADVYALGINLYECWSGEHPVKRDSPAATARAIGAEVPALGYARPDLPHHAAAIVDACLEREPAYRPSIAELQGTLVDAADLLDPERPVPAAASVAGSAQETLPVARDAVRFTIPAVLGILAVLAGLALIGLGGLAVVLVALIGPAVLFVRSPRAWLAPALAPALALVGLAPLYVVAAALVGRTALGRFTLGALGIVWLIVAGSLLGLESPLADLPRATGWADSAGAAADALAAAASGGSVALGVVWALGAASLGAVMSMRVAGLRPVLGLLWAAGLIAAYELVYGTTAAGTSADGGPVPLALAVAVLGVVVVGMIREAAPGRPAPPSAATLPFAGGQGRGAPSPLRAPEGIPGRALDPPAPS